MRTLLAAVLPLSVCLVGCGSPSTSAFVSSVTGVTGVSSAGSNKATTTLSLQTANNTSAANSFLTQTNGNLGANNVSKIDVHSLLYSGSTTKVFAQMLLWFGQPDHMNVGYSSTDPAQVQRQIADMISRGIDGVIVDWYGPNNRIDQATQAVLQEAEKHPGFGVVVMIDAGAIGSSACSGCTPEQTLVQLLQYLQKTYFGSPAYFSIQGQPVITEFGIDDSYAIDWDAVKSSTGSGPRFIFQDQGGFTHALSDGSYSWVMPEAGNYGLGYLSSFYDVALTFTQKETVGATYKGFNDSLASWGSGRVMNQQCGETWLQTFSQINNLYSSNQQLPYLQVVTWNDYEEGTEIESGIDSCVSLQPSVSQNVLQWKTTGNEDTVDHYNVYSSKDGKNLTELSQTPAGVHALNLCGVTLPSGDTQLYVQAVGKPSFANRMPGPVNYTGACD